MALIAIWIDQQRYARNIDKVELRGFEEKILSMYAKGMTTSDIETHIRDIYGIDVSDTTVSWRYSSRIGSNGNTAEPWCQGARWTASPPLTSCCQCYYANRRHRTKPLPPLYILILFCTGFGVYTTFGSEPVVPRALPLKWAEEDL